MDCFNNQGSIVGHQSLNINASNLTNENGGLIKGDYVQLSTKNNLNNLSATIGADSAMQLDVGGDFNNQSLTYSTSSVKGASSSTRTGISQIASIYVGDGLKGQLNERGKPLTTFTANVGGDTTFAAGRLDNQGGSSVIDTKGNVKLDAVNVGYQSNSVGDANNYFKQGESADIGSQLRGNDDVIIKAGNNISGTSVDINSSKGTVGIMAEGNVDFKEGRNKQNLSTANKSTSKGFLSKTTTQNRYDMQSDNAISSNIEGDKVFVNAGQDINFTGTNAISDSGTQLSAGRDVNILAAENTSSESSFSQTKKSGLFGTSGGLGFTIGKQQTDDSNAKTALTHTASNVGAIDGNVTVDAGRDYQQTGSNIVAGMGADSNKDINSADRGNTVIRAQNINIDNTMDVYTNQSEQKFKQSGLTVAVSNSLVDNAKSIDRLVDAGGDTDSMRMKGMAGVAATLKTKALAKEATNAAKGLAGGINANSLKGAGNSRIQATIGSSKSQSNSTSYREENQGSSIDTNNLALIATGAGTDSNININGSSLNVSNDALFQADNDLNVNGVAQNSNTRSNNKNSSTAIGAYASTGNGMGITASASRGKGYANSDSTTYANSQINVGGTTTFDIGRDVNIKGGVINTDRAQGAIGGDVNIESLQDTATYDSKQKNMGFNADLDLKGAGSSLSVNGGKTNLKADYKGVGAQSGIFTGDGGLDLTAKGKTTLIGGAITTTEAARDAGRNNYESLGGIETQDIENTTSYEGDALQVGVSVGNTTGKPQAQMNGIGYGSDEDSDSSVTRAGITGIAGNKDITTDNRAEYAGKLENSFDANQVNKELDAQTQITQEFGKEAPKAVAEFSQNRINAIRANPNLSADEKMDAISKWDEGGIYRVAAHTALGALGTGSVEGALTTGGVAAAAPTINNLEAKMRDALIAQGMDADTASNATKGITSLALAGAGVAVGLDTASTATAVNVDANNRWLHDSELNQIFADGGDKIRKFAKEQGLSYEDAYRAILAQAYRNTDDEFRRNHTPKPGTKESSLAQSAEVFLRKNVLITSTAAERANQSMNRNTTSAKNILAKVERETPSYSTKQKNREAMNKVGKISAEGATKGIGNIPSDTANAYANIIGKEVPRSFPYSSEEAENVGGVAQNVAGVVITVGGIKVNASRGSGNTPTANVGTNKADVWNMSDQFERGRKIEDNLAVTEYSSWQKTDNFIDPKTNKPFNTDNFPLVDFQKGQHVVSVKSANTNGSSWKNKLQKHIQELGRTDITVSGKPVSKTLDIRVQPGGFNDAKPLIEYGIRRNVEVIIKEYK